MRVKVRLFASLRDAASRSEADLDLPESSTAEDAWRALVGVVPALAAETPQPGRRREPALRAASRRRSGETTKSFSCRQLAAA